MSSTEIATQPPLPVLQRSPRTWYFLGSTIAVLIAYATLNLARYDRDHRLVIQHGDPSISPSKLQELAKRGPTDGGGAILACPLVLAVLWVTIRIARRRFSEYLALNLPSRAELLSGLAITLAFLLACDLLSYLTGRCAAGLCDRQLPDRARRRTTVAAARRILYRCSDHRRIYRPGFSVSRLVTILSRADQRDRC